ncbi:MAG: S-layer homology domain-containing protein, partial [Thermoleophilia bacterium]|nr:S-layer homology domain-containing protein [Thermoleophilia bacterium]
GLDPSDALYPDHYIGGASKAGLIFGYDDGTFRPTNSIGRAQVVSMVVRAAEKLHPGLLQTPLSGYRSDWGDFDPAHAANVRTAEYNGLLGLDDLARLDPFAPMTRGEVASVLHAYVEMVRGGPIPSPGPDGPMAEQMAAAILRDQAQIDPEAFMLRDYRISGDWVAAVILWKHVEGAEVVLRRVGGAWTVLLLGTGAVPEDYALLGVPGELIQFFQ